MLSVNSNLRIIKAINHPQNPKTPKPQNPLKMKYMLNGIKWSINQVLL